MIERTFYREPWFWMGLGLGGVACRRLKSWACRRVTDGLIREPDTMWKKPPRERRGLDRTVEVRRIARDPSARSCIFMTTTVLRPSV